MGAFTDLSTDEINQILEHYKLGESLAATPTTEGTSNTNYKVELKSGVNVLLKVSNDKTFEELENEQRILEVLESYNFKYSLPPLKTVLGKSIYKFKNYHGVVFPFVDARPSSPSKDVCSQIGAALAELHSLEVKTENLETIRPHNLVGHGGIDLYEYVNSSFVQEDFKKIFNDIFPRQLMDIPYDLFPSGIIHGDLYYDNALFNNDKLVTLIDFEQSGRSRYLLDLGISISGTCLGEDGNVSLELVEAYMSGYTSKRRLTNLEEDFFDTAVMVGFFSIALWRIQRFMEKGLDDSKKYNYRDLLQKALIYRDLKS